MNNNLPSSFLRHHKHFYGLQNYDSLNNYINDKEFRINLYKDKINVINYRKIVSLEENNISILSANKQIIINGNNFKLIKILENELLIKGNLTNIEVLNEE